MVRRFRIKEGRRFRIQEVIQEVPIEEKRRQH